MNRVLNAIITALPFVASAGTAPDRPNIVIFMTDDQGRGDLGCYGSDRVKTPNIDKLAAEGLRFTQFYAASASSSPSRAGLMTGRSPFRTGIYAYIQTGSSMHLKRDERTIGSILKDAGYDTCFVGKWGLNGVMGTASQSQPNDSGFDYSLAAQNNATPSHLNPDCFFRNGVPMGVMEGYSAQIITDEVINWLNMREDKSRPFCAVVWFQEPHRMIATPEEFAAPYREKFPGKAGKNPEKEKTEPLIADYLGNIAHMDYQVGRLMAAVADMGEARNTLTFFTSDNGPVSPGSTGKLRGGKGSLYEGGFCLPGIMHWPARIKPGRISDEPATQFDILPTLCDITGVRLPADRVMDGESILPLLDGKKFGRTKPLFWWHWWNVNTMVVLRDGDWKLVGTPESAELFPARMEFIRDAELKTFELYNLKDDPFEKKNLAGQHPDRVAKMSRQAEKIYKEMQAENKARHSWVEKDLPPGARVLEK